MANFHSNSSAERLLSSQLSLAEPSIRSSRPASVITTDSIDTIIASPPKEVRPEQPKPYKGFPSEEAYLAALRAWAEEQKYFKIDTQLTGFYGTKTSEYYMNQPGLRSERKARMQADRRNTIARVPIIVSTNGGANTVPETVPEIVSRGEPGRKGSKVGKVAGKMFGRRATVS